MSDSELEEHRVAVTVFCVAPGVDEVDASLVAEAALRRVLTEATGTRVGHECVIEAPFRDFPRHVRVVDVMDIGVAAGNGYLWTRPTGKAYRERGIDIGKEDGHGIA